MTFLKILLVVAAVMQIAATVMAVRLVRATKYNVIWILLAVALLAMSLTRILTYKSLNTLHDRLSDTPYAFYTIIWLELFSSLCIVVIMFYARKLVLHIDNLTIQARLSSKRLLSAVLRTEEKERIRFSKELHDGLGPLISSAKMSLSALSNSASLPASEREIIQGTCSVIEEATRSIREISNNLSPHVLKEFGLERGVGNFIGKLQNMHSVRIDFSSNLQGKRFNTDTEVILYRVICELINNSLKHSGCSGICLELMFDGRNMHLSYRDDGCGFDVAASSGSGMGLSNISSRVDSLGGEIEIASQPSGGMSAVGVIPVKQEGRS